MQFNLCPPPQNQNDKNLESGKNLVQMRNFYEIELYPSRTQGDNTNCRHWPFFCQSFAKIGKLGEKETTWKKCTCIFHFALRTICGLARTRCTFDFQVHAKMWKEKNSGESLKLRKICGKLWNIVEIAEKMRILIPPVYAKTPNWVGVSGCSESRKPKNTAFHFQQILRGTISSPMSTIITHAVMCHAILPPIIVLIKIYVATSAPKNFLAHKKSRLTFQKKKHLPKGVTISLKMCIPPPLNWRNSSSN